MAPNQHFPAVQRILNTGLFPCCPLMMASALEVPQKAVKWQKKSWKLSEVQSQSQAGLCWEHRVCSLQGDAGFWVILESIRVVPRKKISKSLLTTSAFVSFCIYSWFVAKHSCFIPQKGSVLEIIGNIGTLGMRFQESTFSSALPNKTWIC